MDSADNLVADDFQQLIEAKAACDILLLGCGQRMQLPTERVRAKLRGHGIVIDPMDTGAACRTFNVLLTEGRRVAAALIVL